MHFFQIVNLKAELHKKRIQSNKVTADEFRLKQKLKSIARDAKSSKKEQLNKPQDDEVSDDEETLKLKKSRWDLIYEANEHICVF